MPGASSAPLSLTGESLPESLNFSRAGMPAPDVVYATLNFAPSAGAPTYTILRTTEFDEYERSAPKVALSNLFAQGGAISADSIQAALAAPAPVGDDFAGTARRAAKMSIGSGAIEAFADVSALIASLPADASMSHHQPPIDDTATSQRVTEEQRNVRVVGFLYAASREADNDFHLIVGLNPSTQPDQYMTAEVCGLPAANMPSFAKMSAARTSFKTFFGAHVPAFNYDFYHPPIPVVIEGSLFFDITHAIGPHPGPPSLKSRMPTIWEIHPVTSIALGAQP